MKFIIDAHLPKAICTYFHNLGHQAIHTSSLPEGNRTSDNLIAQFAKDDQWVVISKDSDFFYSYQVKKLPPKLIIVRTGNMRLADTKTFFEQNAPQICTLLTNHDLIEVYSDKIVAIA